MSKRTSEDRASSCAFISTHGHQCNMPRASAKSRYCFHHERKLLHSKEAEEVALELFEPLRGSFIPANALTQSLTRLFARVAEGRITPKQAIAMARVADVILKSIPQSIKEFRNIYLESYYDQLTRKSFADLPPYIPPAPPQPRVVKQEEPPKAPAAPSPSTKPGDPN